MSHTDNRYACMHMDRIFIKIPFTITKKYKNRNNNNNKQKDTHAFETLASYQLNSLHIIIFKHKKNKKFTFEK